MRTARSLSKGSKEGKDVWDIIEIIGKILLPIAIFLGSYLVSKNYEESKISISKIEAEVRQAELIGSFMESLSSDDEYQRVLAVEAISIALKGDDKERLLEVVRQADSSANVRELAARRLGIEEVFAKIEVEFSSYEGGFIPSGAFLEKGASLRVNVFKIRSDQEISRTWSKFTYLEDPEFHIESSVSSVDFRLIEPTVDGTMVKQTVSFLNFEGDLGSFRSGVDIDKLVFDATYSVSGHGNVVIESGEGWNAPDKREFYKFYNFTEQEIEKYECCDMSLAPVFKATLKIYFGGKEAFSIDGYVARVVDHDEDVRRLYVGRFMHFPESADGR